MEQNQQKNSRENISRQNQQNKIETNEQIEINSENQINKITNSQTQNSIVGIHYKVICLFFID